jgi:hypothetical protein
VQPQQNPFREMWKQGAGSVGRRDETFTERDPTRPVTVGMDQVKWKSGARKRANKTYPRNLEYRT